MEDPNDKMLEIKTHLCICAYHNDQMLSITLLEISLTAFFFPARIHSICGHVYDLFYFP